MLAQSQGVQGQGRLQAHYVVSPAPLCFVHLCGMATAAPDITCRYNEVQVKRRLLSLCLLSSLRGRISSYVSLAQTGTYTLY